MRHIVHFILRLQNFSELADFDGSQKVWFGGGLAVQTEYACVEISGHRPHVNHKSIGKDRWGGESGGD